MDIAFLLPYPLEIAPGQRFRFEQYLEALEARGHRLHFFPFMGLDDFKILYQKGNTLSKIKIVLLGYLKRFFFFFKAHKFQRIFIYREATPLGPPWVEWLLAKVWRKKLIYDFDDAIWIPTTSAQNRLAAWLKSPQKVPKICKWAHTVSVGNEYLAQNAAQFRGKTEGICHNPTTLDTKKRHNRLREQHRENPLVVGWTGTHSTLIYLDFILPIFQKLQEKYDFTFRVICNTNPEFDLPNFEFVPWNSEEEIEQLLALHIGIMPLTPDPWAAGKCGFKALQYLSLGIPAVASPVGVNAEIIGENERGFLCESPEEWEAALEKLLQNAALRETLGKRGRSYVEEHFSVRSNTENVVRIFER